MRITKAVVPVAVGIYYCPRPRPPQEMLPVGRQPIIHHVVEELIEAGITHIIFISQPQ